jgi:hypothetical protein
MSDLGGFELTIEEPDASQSALLSVLRTAQEADEEFDRYP